MRRGLVLSKWGHKFLVGLIIITLLFSVSVAWPLEAAPLKEETVYVRLNNQGFVQQVYVVNSFLLGKEKEILDYGNYLEVQNLTADNVLKLENGKVRISSQEDRFYYEGRLANPQLPWRFYITYFLDGQKISPEKLAGEKGHLVIQIKIAPNNWGKREFFESYALQLNLTLKDKLCKNIEARGGSLVSAGEDKQVNFIVLPGKTAALEVSADVENFEMPAITITGLRLNLELDVEEQVDLKELRELMAGIAGLDEGVGKFGDGFFELGTGVDKLGEGIGQAAEGTSELGNGARELEVGADKLAKGIKEFNHGLSNFSEGCKQLEVGVGELYTGLEELKGGAANLQSGSGSFAGGLTELKNSGRVLQQGFTAYFDQLLAVVQLQLGVPELTRENYVQVLSEADSLLRLLQGYEQLLGGLNNYVMGVNELAGGSSGLLGGMESLNEGLTAYQKGLEEYLQGMERLSHSSGELVQGGKKLNQGASELLKGMGALKTGILESEKGIWQLVEGSEELTQGMGELADGLIDLHEGSTLLRQKTANLDQDLLKVLKDKLRAMLGLDQPLRSFAADKNGEISGVQFMMQTEGIMLPEKETKVVEVKPRLTFWQRLLRLFGFYTDFS